jgi:hypothetical protein
MLAISRQALMRLGRVAVLHANTLVSHEERAKKPVYDELSIRFESRDHKAD